MADEIDLEDLIEDKDMVITLTQLGYVKRLATTTYRSQRRGGKGITALQTRDEDVVDTVFTASTHQEILFFTTRGRVFKLKAYEIPEAGRTAKGLSLIHIFWLVILKRRAKSSYPGGYLPRSYANCRMEM